MQGQAPFYHGVSVLYVVVVYATHGMGAMRAGRADEDGDETFPVPVIQKDDKLIVSIPADRLVSPPPPPSVSPQH